MPAFARHVAHSIRRPAIAMPAPAIRASLVALAWGLVLVADGCAESGALDPGANPDANVVAPTVDLRANDDFAMSPNACGDYDPTCTVRRFAPPFPRVPDPTASADGVKVDGDGSLVLDIGPERPPTWLWVPHADDLGGGTISRIDTKAGREAARYLTVTCGSLKSASKAACDGTSGCCAADDTPRFEARRDGKPEPPHENVQRIGNAPSRTATSGIGTDVWVFNRAPGGQPSATFIAADESSCADRNRNGRIDSSRDVDGDGVIDTDCNRDGVPDDLELAGGPCKNGMPQEFYGIDDECVLLTVNVGRAGADGRAAASGGWDGNSRIDAVWVGTATDRAFRRISGATGLLVEEVALPAGCVPNGAAADGDVVWVASVGTSPLCYFSTKNGVVAGQARAPGFRAPVPYTIAVDGLARTVWLSDDRAVAALRYTPDRKSDALDKGSWLRVDNAGKDGGATGAGRGLAFDRVGNRTTYVWLGATDGALVRVPASDYPIGPQDEIVDGSRLPVVSLPGFHIAAVGRVSFTCCDPAPVPIWAVSDAPGAVIRCPADAMRDCKVDLASAPAPGTFCPAGDRCLLQGPNAKDPGASAYADLGDFSMRCFCRPQGTYAVTMEGCGSPGETRWLWADWDADVPANTSLKVRARSGDTEKPDNAWGAWSSPDATMSPLDLGEVALVPQGRFLQIEFVFATQDEKVTPRLRSFRVAFECVQHV